MRLAVRSMLWGATVLSVAVLIGMGITTTPRKACAAEPQVSFSQDVLPLLKWKCASCHQPGGEGYKKSGVDLTSYQGLMKGTKFGPMVVPGDAEASNLMMLLDWRVPAEIRMPHGQKKLSVCDRDDIRNWIWQGAKDN